jgi:hypothetical protein
MLSLATAEARLRQYMWSTPLIDQGARPKRGYPKEVLFIGDVPVLWFHKETKTIKESPYAELWNSLTQELVRDLRSGAVSLPHSPRAGEASARSKTSPAIKKE